METNIICPECETENKPDAKRCSKCSYPIAAEQDFDRLIEAKRKKLQKEREKHQKKETENKSEGFFDVLG